MKVAVIGNGNVGKAVFRELQNFREINELVLVGRNAAACYAEAIDYMDAIPLRNDIPGRIDGGGFELCKGADILVYTAGPSVPKGVEDRTAIGQMNIEVMQQVFAEVDKYAANAIVIVVSNPLDVITTAITKYTHRMPNKVIGTGTLLDTARMITIISWALKVSPSSVEGLVLGEHGATSAVIGSSIHIMGMRFKDYFDYECNGEVPIEKDSLEHNVRDQGFKIFRGKGYTSAGVAAAVARIAFDIVNDTHNIYPVSTVLNGEYDVNGFAISVPCMIGREGIESVKHYHMTDDEKAAFDKSASAIREQCEKYNLV